MGLSLPPQLAQAQPEVEALLDEVRGLLGARTAAVPDPLALVAAELPGVEQAAALSRKEPVRAELISRTEAVAHVQRLIDEQLPPERALPMQTGWRALGLLKPDQDLREEILQLYGAQVGGFYDPKRRALFLLDDVHPILQQPVVRHELAHALQDQYWPLTTWLAGAERNEDRAAAMQAVLEGHASDVMNRVTLGGLGLDGSGLSAAQEAGFMAELEELFGDMDLGGGSSADFADFALDGDLSAMLLPRDTPAALRVQILFPYVVGSRFVAGYRQAHPEDPSCRALFDRPPQTTAEVLAPQLWQSGTFAPEHHSPGTFLPGWKQAWSSPLGRLLTHVLFTNQADPMAGNLDSAQWATTNRDKDVVVSAGWAGDHVVVYTPDDHPPGTHMPDQAITVWVSTWTNESAARAAAEAAASRLPEAQIVRSGHRLQVVVGAPEALLPTVHAALRTWK